MLSLVIRRPSALAARRRRSTFRLHVEDLEGRALLSTTTPVNFGATVQSTPEAINGELFFTGRDATHGTQLWETNGTASGTLMLTNSNATRGGLNPQNLTAVGNTLYFSGGDSHGVQLWKSDGTVAGTTLVTNSNHG